MTEVICIRNEQSLRYLRILQFYRVNLVQGATYLRPCNLNMVYTQDKSTVSRNFTVSENKTVQKHQNKVGYFPQYRKIKGNKHR